MDDHKKTTPSPTESEDRLMSRRNTRIFNIAHVALYRTTYRVADGIDQLEQERVRAVSGPDKGESAGRSTDPTSTTERNGTEAARLDLLIADLRDAIDGFDIAHKHLLQLADDACRTRAFAPPPQRHDPDQTVTAPPGQICATNTCTNYASPHTHPDSGTIIDELCDDCWARLCPCCHLRPVEQYRATCDACRKRAERQVETAA